MRMDYINGIEVASNNARTSQVYKATHKGENLLPFMNRSFISFSFGGKNIEDFDLIATVAGDRMEREGYANFDALTSTYDVVHGQFYWGSYYRTNQMSFNLATDGIEQVKLDEFLRWFAAGKVRELILAEHPNRAIMARVAEPPHISVLPFEKKINVMINGSAYKTSTTLYKGVITLNLVMDDPHWYGKINIFGRRDEMGIYRDTWFDPVTQQYQSALSLPDAIKIIHEDGIPLGSMILNTMLLGGNTFATVAFQTYSCIIAQIDAEEYSEHSGTVGYYNNGLSKTDLILESNPYTLTPLEFEHYKGAAIATTDEAGRYISGARIAGAAMSESSGITYLPPYSGMADTWINFYYTGTAPSPTILKFTLVPIIDESNYYISNPGNQYASTTMHPYNIITIECTKQKEFKFTTPNILTSYNKVIEIFNKMIVVGQDWATIRETIRESIWHSAVRAWANRVIDYYDIEGGSGIIEQGVDVSLMKRFLGMMFKDANGNMMPMSFVINAKTGEAVATLSYRSSIDEDSGEIIALTDLENYANYCADNIKTAEENVGDMIKSKYLIIDERNYPDQSGSIVAWQQGQLYSHRLYHDVINGLRDIFLEYKNMYL